MSVFGVAGLAVAVGAIGWSLAYLVFGGGLVGAVVIYLLVKMIGG